MKTKIAFLWQGINGMYGKWHDGLYEAMKTLERIHDVTYLDVTDNLDGYDILIYWEAPCTINGPNAEYYNRIRQHSTPKILLFAGGPVKKEWVSGFDVICVESEINKSEFAEVGIETVTAFGINEKLFKPKKVPKEYKAVHHATCASWKRQWLLPEAFGEEALLIGRFQDSDSHPFTYSAELGARLLGELHDKELVKAICSAGVLVQSSDFWGGGQRATLEAMACGLPVICMEDSPKNREYVEESGAGIICHPDSESIKQAYDEIMKDYKEYSMRGKEYVKNHWTSDHYAINLNKAICNLNKK